MTSLTVKRAPATANIIQSVVIGIILTALSYYVGLHVHWIKSLNYLEIFAVFTSYMSTYLCVVERRFNYPMGAISSAAYCWLFYDSHLVASTILNGYLAVYLVWGYIRWRSDTVTRPVSLVALRWWPAYVIGTAVGYLIALSITHAFGGTMAWTDSLILIGTILAQVLLDNKKLENWVVWAFVNVFAIYTYFHTGLYLVGFQYIFFLANTAFGFGMWYRSYKQNKRKATLTTAYPLAIKPGEDVTVRFIGDEPEVKFVHSFNDEVVW